MSPAKYYSLQCPSLILRVNPQSDRRLDPNNLGVYAMFEKINEVKIFTAGPCGDHGYFFDVAVVPSKLPFNHPARDRFDDRAIAVPNELGSVWVTVYSHEDKSSIAAVATFAATNDSVRCDSVEVNLTHRRRGVATPLYDLASKVFELPIVPSDTLSEDAKAFWSNRQQKV